MRAAQSPELVPEPLPEGRIHDGEQRDPPYSIFDSNAVRRGELTVAERKHLGRTRR